MRSSAGKDVYIEKPMTHRIEDGPTMIEAARRNTSASFKRAASGCRPTNTKRRAKSWLSGKLGKVTKVTASYNRNSSTGSWNYPVPAGPSGGRQLQLDGMARSRAKGRLQSRARVSLSQILGLFRRYLHGPFRSPYHFDSLHHGRGNAEERGRHRRNSLPARRARSARYARRAVRLRQLLRQHGRHVQQRLHGGSGNPIPGHGWVAFASSRRRE